MHGDAAVADPAAGREAGRPAARHTAFVKSTSSIATRPTVATTGGRGADALRTSRYWGMCPGSTTDARVLLARERNDS
jgi:hypothetical protein